MTGDEAMRAFLYPQARGDITARLVPLTDTQQSVYNLVRVGWEPSRIAKRMSMSESAIRDKIAKIKHKGYPI